MYFVQLSPAHSSTVLYLHCFDLPIAKTRELQKHPQTRLPDQTHASSYTCINGTNYSVPLLSITSFYTCKFWLYKTYGYPNNGKNTFLVPPPSFCARSTQMPSRSTRSEACPSSRAEGSRFLCQDVQLQQHLREHRATVTALPQWDALLELVPAGRSGTRLLSPELAQQQHVPTASWCSVVVEKLEGYLALIYKYSFSYRTLSIVTCGLLISKVFWWPYGYCFPQTKLLQAKLPTILYCGGHLLLAPINLIQLLTQTT